MTDRQKRDALLRECAKLEEAWKIRAYEIKNDEILSDEEYDRQMRSAYAINRNCRANNKLVKIAQPNKHELRILRYRNMSTIFMRCSC